jgi:hypothetical protein
MRKGGVAGAHRVVLMRQRCPEQGHNAITHDLIHRAFIAMDRRHHPCQHRIKQLPGVLGIAVGKEFHRPFEIGKEHGHLLALPFQGAPRGENLLGQIGGGVGERWLCGCLHARGSWRRGTRVAGPHEDAVVFIDRQPLAVN